MKVLVIDDMRNIKADLICRTFDEGIEALVKDQWDILYLDHDLGDKIDRNGYHILCWLEENPQYLPKQIKLITSNPVGRFKMMVVLKKLYKETVL